MRPGSVRLRLTLWGVTVLTAVLLLFGGLLRYEMQSDIVHSVDETIARFGHESAARWSSPREDFGPGFPGDGPHGPRPPFPDEAFGKPGRHGHGPGDGPGGPRHFGDGPNGFGRDRNQQAKVGMWQVAPMHVSMRAFTLSGKPVGPATDEPWDSAALNRAAMEGEDVYSTVSVDDEPYRVLTLPLRDEKGVITGVLQVGRSLADLHWALGRLTRTLLLLIFPCLLIAGAGGAFLTSRALRPVRRITLAASAIEAHDLSGRLPETGGDEFAELARTFNGMLTRLEDAFAQQRRFVADASHELKTPLAAIKVHSSLALRGERTPEQYRRTLQTVDSSVDTATRVVQDLLLLARSDTDRLQPAQQPTPLSDVLQRAVDTVTAAAQRNATDDEDEPSGMAPILVELPNPAPIVLGDAHYLTRLFTNLLENAVRYTPHDGRVQVAVTTPPEGVRVEVADTGIGIAPEHLPHLCERFYRVDDSRARDSGGAGLGLAICQSIAEAHGGTLRIESTPGQGTRVIVTLPATVRP